MKSIRNLSEFARQNNISPQLAKQKRDNGYVFGVLDGKQVIYNPKSVMHLVGLEFERYDFGSQNQDDVIRATKEPLGEEVFCGDAKVPSQSDNKYVAGLAECMKDWSESLLQGKSSEHISIGVGKFTISKEGNQND